MQAQGPLVAFYFISSKRKISKYQEIPSKGLIKIGAHSPFKASKSFKSKISPKTTDRSWQILFFAG